jgi:hypothetical protein
MAALVPPFAMIPKSGTNPALKLSRGKQKQKNPLAFSSGGGFDQSWFASSLLGRPLTPEAL